MQKIAKTAAAVTLGLACTLPVLAQDSSTTTASPSTSSAQMAQSQPSDTSGVNTQSMGAGPEDMNTTDGGRDMGWIGLLGLAGLLGLRRRAHHDDHRHDLRGAPTR